TVAFTLRIYVGNKEEVLESSKKRKGAKGYGIKEVSSGTGRGMVHILFLRGVGSPCPLASQNGSTIRKRKEEHDDETVSQAERRLRRAPSLQEERAG
ncbi:MAG: hypothetical protein J6M12_06190, partial [Clostridia bacterium]|nr:hypothetical protein [Clostridia bacterium]